VSAKAVDDNAPRRFILATLAKATPAELASAVLLLRASDGVVDLKGPEIGLIMLRGRMGGDGAAFNCGEASMARSVVRLASGEVGYGMRLGRDMTAARNAAILDACWQSNVHRDVVESCVLAKIHDRISAERSTRAAHVAATRVDFFTLAREAE
jgi:alpha-D-ribose 1-methylphosphonate 5-triphosphate synthase subunit PhnG